MKILLLNPPAAEEEKFTREGRCTQNDGFWSTLWPPVSLVYTGTLLKKSGHDVKVLDCPAVGMAIKQLEGVIRSYAPDAIIWSTATPTIEGDLSLASRFKSIAPSVKTAVFGTHVSILDMECMAGAPLLDAVIRNEPEYTALDWINSLGDPEKNAAIEGITIRNRHGEIVRNPAREFITDLDRLPFPDWSLINFKSYVLPLKGEPFLIVSPLRGCPYTCAFCTSRTYYGSRTRLRSPSSLIAEMQNDIDTFGVRDFFFWAETFTVNRAFVVELCREIIKSGLKISWVCNARVDTVDNEMLGLMRDAGCWMVSYGIESSDQAVLKNVKKNITVEQVRKAVDMTRANGLISSGHVIFGLPGETAESARATADLVADLNLDFAQFYCAVPFPGSELYGMAVEKGYISTRPSGGFECFRQEKAVMSLPTISTGEVEAIRKEAVRTFYMRPSRVLKLLKLMRWKSLLKSLPAALKFIKGLF
ncbi:MAG: radical SAM protein [Nitrospirae bacterium]|nr:radical SAM protein [Nitrospirota bacterium]